MDKSLLKNFGLSKNDSLVYEALLSLGKVKVGSIIQTSGITSSRVYASLSILKRCGLVSSVVKNNIRHYQAEPPVQLLNDSVQQVSLLQSFIQNFSLPTPSESSDRITVYEGTRGYQQAFFNHIDKLPLKSKTYIIGYGSLYRGEKETRSFFKQVDEHMLKRKCTADMVLDASLIATFWKDRKHTSMYSFRSLPSRYFSAMAVNISDNEVMFSLIGTRPVAICLRDHSIISAFKKYFKILWETGMEIKTKKLRDKRVAK